MSYIEKRDKIYKMCIIKQTQKIVVQKLHTTHFSLKEIIILKLFQTNLNSIRKLIQNIAMKKHLTAHCSLKEILIFR